MKNINKIAVVLAQLIDDESLYNDIMNELDFEKVETIVNVMQCVVTPVKLSNPELYAAFECDFKETYIDNENWIFLMNSVGEDNVAYKMLEGSLFIHVEGLEMEETDYRSLCNIVDEFPYIKDNPIVEFAKEWIQQNE
jgi:hypothetical protein